MNQISKKPSRFSRSVMFFSTLFIMATQLVSNEANAINIPVSTFTCTQSMTATTVCVGSGFYAAGWQSGTGYWQYTLNTVGFSGTIAMNFSNTKSSAPGPTSGQVYYNIGAGDVPVSGGAFAVATSCQAQSITLPAVCSGVSNLIIKVKMLGATNNTATHRISADNVFDGTSATCTAAPAAGTIAASATTICAGTTADLTLTGSSNGAGITHQWQSSTNNTTWTNIAGATDLTFTTPTLTSNMYYRVVSACTGVGSPVNSPSQLITVNTVAINPISVPNNPMFVGTVQHLSNTTPGGLWLSSQPSVGSIDASGNLTGNFGGTTQIAYQVTSPSNGCVGKRTVDIQVLWPNTLALYAGVDGNSVGVIPVADESVSDLYAKGFGTTTPCGSGGLSGLTVNVANTAYNKDSAHVGFMVYPDPGNVLNMYRIHARARVSSTGPTKARIAYRYWSAGTPGTWTAEGVDQPLVTGSCGASANSWDFNTAIYANPNPTVNGIKDSLEVAVFPFAPGASTGTFQLNTLEVYGIVTTDATCGTGIVTTADSALPAVVNICDTGSRFLNYNLGTGGVAGVGVTYQWQSSTTSPTTGFADIAGATGAVYHTPNFTTPDTIYYRVKVTCSGVSEFSAPNFVSIANTPANAGTVTGAIASSTDIPFRHALIGTGYTLSSSLTGGTWSSNDTSVISINPTSGAIVPHIPGDAIITYRRATAGCFGVTRDTVVAYLPGTKALYVGRGGNSTNVYKVSAANGTSATALAFANWGSTTPCSNGGYSGLTNTNTGIDQTTNGSIITRVAATGTNFNATQMRATVRGSASTTYKAYLAYKPVGGSTWFPSASFDVEPDDCGYSHNEIVFNFTQAVNAAGVDFALFGYNGASTNGLQLNSLSVIGNGNAIVSGTTAFASSVELFPNPANSTLNVKAAEQVNVVILSIDGRKLIEQNNAKQINVSNLVSGMYLIQVYNADNTTLLKADKFVKQ